MARQKKTQSKFQRRKQILTVRTTAASVPEENIINLKNPFTIDTTTQQIVREESKKPGLFSWKRRREEHKQTGEGGNPREELAKPTLRRIMPPASPSGQSVMKKLFLKGHFSGAAQTTVQPSALPVKQAALRSRSVQPTQPILRQPLQQPRYQHQQQVRYQQPQTQPRHQTGTYQPPPPKPKRSMRWPKFKMPSRKVLTRQLGIFIVGAIVLVTPIYASSLYSKAMVQKQVLIADTKTGLKQLQDGVDLLAVGEKEAARTAFADSQQTFTQAEKELKGATLNLTFIVKRLPGPGKQVAAADNVIHAGLEAAQAGEQIAKSMQAIEALGTIFQNKDQEIQLTEALVVAKRALDPALEHIKNAIGYVKKIDESVVPEENKPMFALVQSKLPLAETTLNQVNGLFNGLLTVLGHEQKQRYLLVFGNNDELRATLGFIGGFALIDIDEGHVGKIEVPGGGIYDASSWLDQKLQAPAPLRLVNAHWFMQDANWWPDWPTSAQKLMWFYEHSQGPSVDGVIGITPDIIERLLVITGPIDMTKDYGEIIDSTNFRQVAQESAEIELKGTETPKQLLADLTPILLDKVFQLKKEDMLPTLMALNQAITEREMLIYFRDTKLEQQMRDFGWAGQIEATDKDYLAIIKTNIAGGKTDGVIDDSVSHDVQVNADGSITDTITYTRVHNGDPKNILQGVKNTSFLRFYVPEGSTLLRAEGFTDIPDSKFSIPDEDAVVDEDFMKYEGNIVIDEITGMRIQNSFGKTVFGNWLEVGPGEGKTVTLEYRLPFRLNLSNKKQAETYSVFYQKQAGARAMTINTKVTYPRGVTITRALPEGSVISTDNATLTTDLKTDIFFGVLTQPAP